MGNLMLSLTDESLDEQVHVDGEEDQQVENVLSKNFVEKFNDLFCVFWWIINLFSSRKLVVLSQCSLHHPLPMSSAVECSMANVCILNCRK